MAYFHCQSVIAVDAHTKNHTHTPSTHKNRATVFLRERAADVPARGLDADDAASARRYCVFFVQAREQGNRKTGDIVVGVRGNTTSATGENMPVLTIVYSMPHQVLVYTAANTFVYFARRHHDARAEYKLFSLSTPGKIPSNKNYCLSLRLWLHL